MSGGDEYSIYKNDEFCIKMMNSALQMMNFALQMMNFALKMADFGAALDGCARSKFEP